MLQKVIKLAEGMERDKGQIFKTGRSGKGERRYRQWE